MANFKATKIDFWEEYAVIDFCAECEENIYDLGDTRRDVSTGRCTKAETCNEKGYTLNDGDNILRELRSERDDDSGMIVEKPGRGFEIQRECKLEKNWTYSRAINNDTNNYPNVCQEEPCAKECCHTGRPELGTISEKTAADFSTHSDCRKRLTAVTSLNLEGKTSPKLPDASCTFLEKLHFIETGICWIKSELRGLREVDQRLIETFSELISQSRRLKKLKETFLEQQEILEEIDDIFEKEEFENLYLLDKPLFNDARVGIQRKISNFDRYIRVGRVGRRASHY